MPSSIQSSSSRRTFLKQMGILCAASSVAKDGIALPLQGNPQPSAPAPNSAVTNRAPLSASMFYPLPLGAIRPRGWLHDQLRIQADGLSGHLDETWADVGPNSGWLGGTGESWERGPYFLDGLIPLAYLLDDARLKAKAQKYLDWTLDHPWPNGMIGPKSNDDWWPRMVMLKALTQFQEASGDPRVIPVMEKYFAYQLDELPKRPLRDWGKFRWQDNALAAIWLYNRTGNPKLLELARLLHDQGHDWIAQFEDFKYTGHYTAESLKLAEGDGLKDLALSTHGVNNGQAIKTGPVWSLVSGSESDRHAVLKMISELDRYHGLPNGMFSCDEHLAGTDPVQGSELCTVVEYMFSLEQSLAILGDPALGDKLERLAYNALPGTLTDDMWAHQYNQEPNQVECSLHTKPWSSDGPESNLFGLAPNFGCCTANFHQGWPKFAASLLMASTAQPGTSGDGLVAAAYAPCEVQTELHGVPIRLVEETSYPFHGTVRIAVSPQSPLAFPLRLRIPAWASGTMITVNGQAQTPPSPGTFAIIDRKWKAGDRVEIVFPMQPRVSRWFHDSIAVERGPLVFSYGIGEDWVKLRDQGMTADWQVYPTRPWNYALEIDPSNPSAGIAVNEAEVGAKPFSARNAPVHLNIKARKLPAWRSLDGVAGTLPQSPVATGQPAETITLIPYAAAKLRITAFPQWKSQDAPGHAAG